MKIVKMALIGAGLWGKGHAEIYATHPNAVLKAVCDAKTDRAREIAALYNANAYDDYNEMLKKEDIDAVAVVTPDFAHAAPALAAAAAGKHILLEKPLATTKTDAVAICQAVKENKIQLMVDFHGRWNPPSYIMKQDIDSGKIGKVVSAYLRHNDTIYVPTQMLSWAAKSSIIWFLGSHAVDTLSWLLSDRVKRVFSVSSHGILQRRGIDTEDLFQSTLEFEKGAVAQVENSWVVPNGNPHINDFKLNVTGESGMFNMDFSHSQFFERYLENTMDHPDFLVTTQVQGKPFGLGYESIRDFVECIAEDKPVKVKLQEALNVTMTLLAIKRSAASREPVEVEHINVDDV